MSGTLYPILGVEGSIHLNRERARRNATACHSGRAVDPGPLQVSSSSNRASSTARPGHAPAGRHAGEGVERVAVVGHEGVQVDKMPNPFGDVFKGPGHSDQYARPAQAIPWFPGHVMFLFWY